VRPRWSVLTSKAKPGALFWGCGDAVVVVVGVVVAVVTGGNCGKAKFGSGTGGIWGGGGGGSVVPENCLNISGVKVVGGKGNGAAGRI